jgi:hypothetical protein
MLAATAQRSKTVCVVTCMLSTPRKGKQARTKRKPDSQQAAGTQRRQSHLAAHPLPPVLLTWVVSILVQRGQLRIASNPGHLHTSWAGSHYVSQRW